MITAATVEPVRLALKLFFGSILLVLVAAACSGNDEDRAGETVRGIVEIDPSASSDEDDESDTSEDPADEADDAESQEKVFARLEGTTTQPGQLEPGDCFNEYRYRDRAEVLQQITTIVECSRPHDKEVYFNVEHPAPDGAPFRGREEISQFARDKCLDAFEEFVGEEYVLSQLEIGFFQPSYETWISTDNDRSVSCYVHPYEEGRQLQGSMSNIGF